MTELSRKNFENIPVLECIHYKIERILQKKASEFWEEIFFTFFINWAWKNNSSSLKFEEVWKRKKFIKAIVVDQWYS